jgi:hypothetical protein
MKYLFIVLTFGLVIGCTPPTSVTTPVGKTAYTADQLVNSLGIFQDAAIGANSQKILSDNSTRLIVTYVKSAVTVIKASPNGWQATVAAGLAQLQKDLPAADLAKYQVYINLINSIIVSL